MPLWLTALTALTGWVLLAGALGLLLARHIHRTPRTPHQTQTGHHAATPRACVQCRQPANAAAGIEAAA
ncbi:hypothetical protein [Streptomyces sp. NPDC058623]|uniref:hypothetical protein n=1 Tax=Streptomyces sp. NPDC058623 TaxID=3346563 RepID=UPI00365E6F04